MRDDSLSAKRLKDRTPSDTSAGARALHCFDLAGSNRKLTMASFLLGSIAFGYTFYAVRYHYPT